MLRMRWMPLALTLAVIGASDAFAQIPEIGQYGIAGTGTVTIKKIRTGLDADQFAIETREPIMNPAGCPIPDGYVATTAKGGYKEAYAAALSAMYSGKPVQVTLSDLDCAAQRPRIMGVQVMP